ncbi:hypothetical protein [Thalassoporum mexicanum]|nr:hypothetical protein [Pseudanabaena sp. PCC 7367]
MLRLNLINLTGLSYWAIAAGWAGLCAALWDGIVGCKFKLSWGRSLDFCGGFQ